MSTKQTTTENCSFCGKIRCRVKYLVKGGIGFICDFCIEKCNCNIDEMELSTHNEKLKENGKGLPKPMKIKA